MLQSPSPQANDMDYKKWKKQNAVLVSFSGWFLSAECVECQYRSAEMCPTVELRNIGKTTFARASIQMSSLLFVTNTVSLNITFYHLYFPLL